MALKLLVLILITIIVITTAVGITSLALYKVFDKQEDKLKKATEARLNSALKSLCFQLKIPLSYHNELGEAAGRILYHSQQGRLLLDKASIEIMKQKEDRPYVLAHELGHYMAIRQREDTSEQGADMEAYTLCCSILTKEEQDLLAIALKCHFLLNIQK